MIKETKLSVHFALANSPPGTVIEEINRQNNNIDEVLITKLYEKELRHTRPDWYMKIDRIRQFFF